MDPSSQAAFIAYANALGWNPNDVSTWNNIPQFQPSQAPPTQVPETQVPFDTPGTHGSGINVDDYDISDMEPTGSFEDEMTSGSQPKDKGKGKGKAKSTTVGGKNYSIEESKAVARCYVDVSEDPVIGSGQRVRKFWERIAEAYNRTKPTWARERDWDNLRKHWSRIQTDLAKYCSIVTNVEKLWPSGANSDDIRAKCHETFREQENKEFRLYDVYLVIRDHPKFACGTDLGGPKRTKTNASGHYTSSGGEGMDLNSHVEESFGTHTASDVRPMGQKAAKRKGKSAAKAAASASATPPQSELDPSLKFVGEALLWHSYQSAVCADPTRMTEDERARWSKMVAELEKKLGVI